MKTNYLLCVVLMAFITACSVSEDTIRSKSVEPKTLKISGTLSKYIEIVDGDYEVSERTSQDVSLTIVALKPMPTEKLKGKVPTLSLKFLDSKGAPISSIEPLILQYAGTQALRDLLLNGEGEEILELTTIFAAPLDKSDWNRISQFVLTSSLEEDDSDSESDTELDEETEEFEEDEPEEKPKTSKSNKVDKAMDDLELEIDKFSKYMKKNMPNNPIGVMAEYNKVLLKIHNLVESAGTDKESITPAQMSRMLIIQAKLAEFQQKLAEYE